MNEILAAVIGGLFTLVGAYLTWFLSRRPPEVGGFTDIAAQRVEGVRGTWMGTLVQPEYPGGPVATQIKLKLDVKRGMIIGTAEAAAQFNPKLHGSSERVELELKVRGGFYSDSLLKLDYKNTSVGVLQFGAMVLRMNARSTEMEGQMVGYGSYAERVIQGQLELRKAP